jgi:hypothetical protein
MFTGWHVVKLGSNANNSANTGAFYMNANNTASKYKDNIPFYAIIKKIDKYYTFT